MSTDLRCLLFYSWILNANFRWIRILDCRRMDWPSVHMNQDSSSSLTLFSCMCQQGFQFSRSRGNTADYSIFSSLAIVIGTAHVGVCLRDGFLEETRLTRSLSQDRDRNSVVVGCISRRSTHAMRQWRTTNRSGITAALPKKEPPNNISQYSLSCDTRE